MPSASEQRKTNISLMFEWSKAYEKKNGSLVNLTVLMNKTYELFQYSRLVTRRSYCYAVMELMRLERMRDASKGGIE